MGAGGGAPARCLSVFSDAGERPADAAGIRPAGHGQAKLFDADNHGKRVIASGVHQVVNYAQDYSKTAAYVVLINLGGRPLELPTGGGDKEWPRFVDLGGVRVHLISFARSARSAPARWARLSRSQSPGRIWSTRTPGPEPVRPVETR
jgi:hypothetical protein